MTLTLDKIHELAAFAKARAIKPKRVQSKRQAREMTKHDPIGQKWEVGDEYYLLRTVDGDSPIRLE